MRFCLKLALAAALLGGGVASAEVVIVGVNGQSTNVASPGTLQLSGTTSSVAITGTNLRPGGTPTTIPQRWDATATLGTFDSDGDGTNDAFQGTFGGTDANSNDWQVLIGDTGGTRQLNTAVGGASGFNFLQISYSLDSAVTLPATGTGGQRFSVNGNSPAEIFARDQQELLPMTAGDHSFIIDLNQLSAAGAEIDFIRWDPWNDNDAGGLNRGTVFTISDLTFSTAVASTAVIPEPTSASLLALGFGAVAIRRRRRSN